MRFKNFESFPVTGKEGDTFVGLKIVDNRVSFFYPELFHFDAESPEARMDVLLLLKSLSLAKTRVREDAIFYKERIDDSEFALDSYLWLINDYLTNGPYVNYDVILRENQTGKVDWKRTMRMNPVISNGNIIYRELIVRTKGKTDNLLVHIYNYCLKRSIDYIGWLFNLDSSFLGIERISSNIKKLYIKVLADEVNSSFDDIKRNRFTHMLNVLLGLDSSEEKKPFAYGVNKFHVVFEKMIDSVYGNTTSKTVFNPVGKWQLVKHGFEETSSSHLRPDTVILMDGKAYVIDAKFYRFGQTGSQSDLPDTTSIQKQITYGDYIKTNCIKGVTDVYNAFLLPYDMFNKRNTENGFESGQQLQYVGFAKTTWKENASNHNVVHTFLIDLKSLVYEWRGRNRNKDIKNIIASIDDAKVKAAPFL